AGTDKERGTFPDIKVTIIDTDLMRELRSEIRITGHGCTDIRVIGKRLQLRKAGLIGPAGIINIEPFRPRQLILQPCYRHPVKTIAVDVYGLPINIAAST